MKLTALQIAMQMPRRRGDVSESGRDGN